jgi:hypothetical protein
MRDIGELNQWSKKGLYDLAKQTIGTMYFTCLQGHNEVIDRLWSIVDSKDKKVNYYIRLQALRLILDAGKAKFDLYINGPSVLEVEGLKDRVDGLKESLKERNYYKPTTYEAAMREKQGQGSSLERELNLEEYKRSTGQLDKASKKKVHFVLDPNKISRHDIEKLGVPNEFEGWNKKELTLDVDKISRVDLERLGIPYEIVRDEEATAEDEEEEE